MFISSSSLFLQKDISYRMCNLIPKSEFSKKINALDKALKNGQIWEYEPHFQGNKSTFAQTFDVFNKNLIRSFYQKNQKISPRYSRSHSNRGNFARPNSFYGDSTLSGTKTEEERKRKKTKENLSFHNTVQIRVNKTVLA